MKSATPVNKDQRELVRILYLEHGPQRAAELSKVRYDRIRQWASRYGWAEPREKALSQTVTRQVADTIADTLAEHERETRLSLARYAARAAKDAEQMSTREAPLVHKVAQIAGLTHAWGEGKTATAFTLNVLNINSLDNRLGEQDTVIDTE